MRSYDESPSSIAQSLGISESRVVQLQATIRSRYLPGSRCQVKLDDSEVSTTSFIATKKAALARKA